MASTLDNDNITVDACPSPPRVAVDDTTNPLSGNSQKQNHQKGNPRSYKSGKKNKHEEAKVINFNIHKAHNIRFGPEYNITINKGENQNDGNSKRVIEKTPSIKQLLSRTDPVTKDIMIFVSQNIGEHWKTAARLLGFNEGKIQQFREDHHIGNVEEIVYQLLLDWIQNKPDVATVGKLFTALWEAKEFCVVNEMAEKVETNSSN